MLTDLAWLSLGVAAICSAWIVIDEIRHPQAMWIMNIVWPATALYVSVFALWGYIEWGRRKTREAMDAQGGMKTGASDTETPPTIPQVALSTTHCGAGCVLADIACEFSIAAAGFTLLGSVLWAEYAIDFAAAWALGIVFQYFTIKPMRKLTPAQGLLAAMKADTLSITAFQVGMYAWMALVFFVLFPKPHLTPFDPRYWLMMQLAMVCGFATSYPMNILLIRIGWKEKM